MDFGLRVWLLCPHNSREVALLQKGDMFPTGSIDLGHPPFQPDPPTPRRGLLFVCALPAFVIGRVMDL